MSHIYQEFKIAFDAQKDFVQDEDDGALDFLFEDLVEKKRAQTSNTTWKQEMDLYKSLPRLEKKGDPLQWWQLNINQLPTLCMNYFCCIFSSFH